MTSPHRAKAGMIGIGTGCLALAGASLLLPIAPAYDPWSWLLWGREVTRLELSTAQGPAFKPLPVAVTSLLGPLGGAAPALWLLVARLGALAALVLGFVVARRLAGGGRPGALAGAAAAVGVALTDGFLVHAAVGNAEPLFVGLALGAFAFALSDRHGPALTLAALAALLRPESWPFLAAYAAWRAWVDPRLRPAVLIGAASIPAAWLVPEWLGSGEPLRSGARALEANPGAPALADHPALASLSTAVALLFLPTAAAVIAVRGRAALLLAGAGAAWLLLVALMAEAGFSGEPRYALPGAALVAVSGGVGLARLVGVSGRRLGSGSESPASGSESLATGSERLGTISAWRETGLRVPARSLPMVALVIAAAPFFAVRVADLADFAPRLAHQAAFAAALPGAIDAAGGRDRLLACGRPAVGRFRGPLLAYHLDLEKRRVRADGMPAAVTFRSRLRSGDPLEPGSAEGARALAATGGWRIESACPPTTIARASP